MPVNDDRTPHRALHPIHVVLLAGIIPLFLGGLLSDIAYASSYEIQWNNFASWLIAGALGRSTAHRAGGLHRIGYQSPLDQVSSRQRRWVMADIGHRPPF